MYAQCRRRRGWNYHILPIHIGSVRDSARPQKEFCFGEALLLELKFSSSSCFLLELCIMYADWIIVTVLSGETGTGKSTQIPQFLLEAVRLRRLLAGMLMPPGIVDNHITPAVFACTSILGLQFLLVLLFSV